MSTRKGPRTDRELVEAFEHLLYDHEPETPEEVDAFLRSEGLDPETIVANGRAFVQKALASSPLNWRSHVSERQTAKEELAAHEVSPTLSRDDLLATVKKLLSGLSPQQIAQTGVRYRNLEEVTDDDLRSLLAELEYLNREE